MDGEHHGQGRLTLKSGAVYKGEFSHGNYNGYGEFTYANGEKYQGQWY